MSNRGTSELVGRMFLVTWWMQDKLAGATWQEYVVHFGDGQGTDAGVPTLAEPQKAKKTRYRCTAQMSLADADVFERVLKANGATDVRITLSEA